ncbi:MAG: M81 family metallopeptidase, partial [Hyphomicrobiaceae bacterium]
MSAPRVAILGVILESNRQSPVAKAGDFDSFYRLEGSDILDAARADVSIMAPEAAAFVKAMDATGPWQPQPILLAACHPHGPIDQDLHESYLATIREGLQAAMPLDAVYIANHGAMVATRSHDPDGDIIALAREVAGPKARIIVTLDLHANISDEMVAESDLIVGYRTNPHVDMIERGEEAALSLRLMLAGHADPQMHLVRLPITPPSVTLLSAEAPYGAMIDLGQR